MKMDKYWCRPGSHTCHANDLVVTFEHSHVGICRDCVVRRVKGQPTLKNYWTQK